MTPTIEQQTFIEKMGLYYEQAGSSRMMGRLLAWLLITDPPAQTAEECMEALQVSRGAISTTARQLVDLGLVERVSLPGIRADYYQLKPGAWAQMLRQTMGMFTQARLMAEEGLHLVAESRTTPHRRLEEMQHFYAFWEARMPELMAEWEADWQRHRRETASQDVTHP